MVKNNRKGTVLITGGAKRIGRAIALGLAENGFRVALHFRFSQKEAEEVAALIDKQGGTCEIFQADLSKFDDVNALIPQVFKKCPDLSILVNNASLFQRKGFLETEEELFDRHFNLNLKAPFFLTQQFAKSVQKGHVINILDTKITHSSRHYFAYTLTKKTLFEFTKMAAKELGPKTRVNGVAPGLIMPSKSMSHEEFEKLGSRIPLKQTGNPDYILSAICFLINHPFVTGQCLYIDGGEHLP